MDAEQIRAALDRAEVFDRPNVKKKYDPKPILPADLHKLLAAGQDIDRAAILLSLNCCMYADEVLDVDWSHVDLEVGTFKGIRAKTGILRVGVLWNRTVDALKKLPRTDGAIFKSPRGRRYNTNAFRDRFAVLRRKAGVDASVQYNNIRDGAYTAACTEGVEFHLTRILAGHRQSGKTDCYVARNPLMVAPACAIIESAYFGESSRRQS